MLRLTEIKLPLKKYTDDDLRAIARDFGVTLNEKFLN